MRTHRANVYTRPQAMLLLFRLSYRDGRTRLEHNLLFDLQSTVQRQQSSRMQDSIDSLQACLGSSALQGLYCIAFREVQDIKAEAVLDISRSGDDVSVSGPGRLVSRKEARDESGQFRQDNLAKDDG